MTKKNVHLGGIDLYNKLNLSSELSRQSTYRGKNLVH